MAPYLALTEPLSQATAPSSGPYNRKALVLLALVGSLGSVALWNHYVGGEQQLSDIAMNILPSQMMQARVPMMPMQSANAWQPMWSARSQPFLQPVRAEAAAKPKPKPKPKPTPPPFNKDDWESQLTDQLKDPSKTMVKFGGGTGGLLRKASVEEMYIMTWDNPKGDTIFEMPTGGAAVMNPGSNMIFLARKEYGIALGTKLRSTFKIKQYRLFRRTPNGEIQFIHPADGVFPEKANPGRKGDNQVKGSILSKSGALSDAQSSPTTPNKVSITTNAGAPP